MYKDLKRENWKHRTHDLDHVVRHQEMSILFYLITLQKRLWTWENKEKIAALVNLKCLVGMDTVYLGLLSFMPFDIVLMVVDYDRRKMKFLRLQLQMATHKKSLYNYPGLHIEILLPPVEITASRNGKTLVYRAVGCKGSQIPSIYLLTVEHEIYNDEHNLWFEVYEDFLVF